MFSAYSTDNWPRRAANPGCSTLIFPIGCSGRSACVCSGRRTSTTTPALRRRGASVPVLRRAVNFRVFSDENVHLGGHEAGRLRRGFGHCRRCAARRGVSGRSECARGARLRRAAGVRNASAGPCGPTSPRPPPQQSLELSNAPMKQVLRRGIGEMIVADVPEPVASSQQVLVHPLYSLISSGTETANIHQDGVIKEVAHNPSHIRKVLDVMKVNGPLRTLAEVRAKFSEYAVLGYSGAGVVVGKHAAVGDLQIGDRVAYGGEGTGHGEVIVTGRKLVARIPDDVSFDHASFTTLGSIALNSIRIANIQLGEMVVVIGLGLVGQLVAQLARLQGAVVIASDLNHHRVEMATSMGADHGVISGDGLRDAVSALTNGRFADCVIVAAAAKSAGPCLAALSVCRDRGRIVVVGAVEMSFPWNDMYLKEIQLLMSRAYGPGSYDPSYEQRGQDYPLPYVRWTENRNMEEFLRLLSRKQINVAPLVSHTYTLDQAPAAYQTIVDPSTNSLAVLLKYDEAHADAAVKAFAPARRLDLSTPGPRGASELRVALVGSGNLARWAHLPALKSISGAKLHAVHSAAGARGRTYGERFGAAYCTTDFEQILADKDVDVVLITSRNQHHADQAARSLRAGKHVFVEKPMALTAGECDDLIAATYESGRQLT